jgi:23S rRNA (uracil1939-C5)-methyltransferase
MINQKTKITIKAERPAYGGASIGRYKGKVVIVRGAIPGETVEAVIEDEKKDYYTALVTNVKTPSSDRVQPGCRYFGMCGGCQLQFISYKRQVAIKEEILRDSFQRIAKTAFPLGRSIIDEHPWHYRSRAQFKVSKDRVGFYRAKSREIVDIDSCPLMVEEINEKYNAVKGLIREEGISEIHISQGDNATALLRFRKQAMSPQECDSCASQLLGAGFAGVCMQGEDKTVMSYGTSHITLNLDILRYTASPMSFFQSHWLLNQSVIAVIKERLRPLKRKSVLDLYAGAGNFSLPLAGEAEVTAVEENLHSIDDGMRNAEINSLEHVHFIHSAAEEYSLQKRFDILILDPPRPGLTRRVADTILTAGPGTIVYISCNPSTLARDLRKLLKKYKVTSIQLVDFFPQTFHIESLVFLKSKE